MAQYSYGGSHSDKCCGQLLDYSSDTQTASIKYSGWRFFHWSDIRGSLVWRFELAVCCDRQATGDGGMEYTVNQASRITDKDPLQRLSLRQSGALPRERLRAHGSPRLLLAMAPPAA
eukprot:scaffold324891_cov67-Tisochrysis_lutea.AAC.1